MPHVLPEDRAGHTVDAPNFGERLYQDVGIGTYRSGYSSDGKTWRDGDERPINQPRPGEPLVPIAPLEQGKPKSGSLDLSLNAPGERANSAIAAVALSPPDQLLLGQIVEKFRPVDAAHGKAWDDNSDRICSSMLGLAKVKKFTAADDLRIAFNQPSGELEGGRLVHLYRVGPTASPDPYANRAHMTTTDALSMPVEARYRQAEAVGRARAEALQPAAQHEQVRANEVEQAGTKIKV